MTGEDIKFYGEDTISKCFNIATHPRCNIATLELNVVLRHFNLATFRIQFQHSNTQTQRYCSAALQLRLNSYWKIEVYLAYVTVSSCWLILSPYSNFCDPKMATKRTVKMGDNTGHEAEAEFDFGLAAVVAGYAFESYAGPVRQTSWSILQLQHYDFRSALFIICIEEHLIYWCVKSPGPSFMSTSMGIFAILWTSTWS